MILLTYAVKAFYRQAVLLSLNILNLVAPFWGFFPPLSFFFVLSLPFFVCSGDFITPSVNSADFASSVGWTCGCLSLRFITTYFTFICAVGQVSLLKRAFHLP